MTLRRVQLVPALEANPGMIATTPAYSTSTCSGCPHSGLCRDRGRATSFRVVERRGKPLHCRRIGGPMIPCRVEHVPWMETAWRHRVHDSGSGAMPIGGASARAPPRAPPLWLCDANVFINAGRWKWRECIELLARAGRHYRLATTQEVFDELLHDFELPPSLEIVDAGALDPRLLAHAAAHRGRKRASAADLSLVQALVTRPEAMGILTADLDLLELYPAGLVRDIAGREVRIMTCERFCRTKPGLFGHGRAAR